MYSTNAPIGVGEINSLWTARQQSIGTNGYVMHSFRHSMRDRLRAVNCPSGMIDQIGGWSKRSGGEGYGEGFGLDKVYAALKLVAGL